MAVTWRAAADEALYGPGGFYRVNRPGAHFRTSVQAAPDLFADAIGELLARVDSALGQPDPIDLVDVGAGGGELFSALSVPGALGRRLRLTAVERGPRPAGVGYRWGPEIPPVDGLLVANEWLDNVPVDVATRDASGVDRVVLVSPSGEETPGPVVSGADAAWLERWWPLRAPGDRAEIGLTRDAAWAAAVGQVRRGLAVAVDYGHVAGARPVGGTLTGYRGGRQVPPVPDGSCDLTAHVAMDSLAPGAPLRRQRDVLRALGLSGGLPPRELASADPARYLHALSSASRAAELLAPDGLGAFYWLLQPLGEHGLSRDLDLGLGVPEAADLADREGGHEPAEAGAPDVTDRA
ncbi:SAM-dependent methyltransferase [Cryptosporangium japonicum]|uniref:SAM-dependent methyltransferase n=1 Tax=Cryptosporangium japonicum TaxID=80872 RepID=A0ABN0UVR0_9ACTN